MARPTTMRGRRPLAVLAAAATGLSGMALLAPGTSIASSHREAPGIQNDPRVDNTDTYSFVSPDDPDTVTLVANWYPFQEPDGGPNFYRFDENAEYDIRVDNDGDARPDITYRWTFTTEIRNPDTFLYNTGVVESIDDPDLNLRQFYDLRVITDAGVTTTLLDNAPVAPSNVGPASMPDYATLRDQAIAPIGGGAGGQSFAGQADDPFFLDLRVFDLLYGAEAPFGSVGEGDLDEVGNDTLNGRNVQTIAIQVPKEAVALNANADRNPVIGVWSTTQRRSTRVLSTDGSGTEQQSGDFVQVSRLGMPLVNEVIIPIREKDRFNRTTPVNDETFLPFVQDPEVPRLIELIYGIPAPDTDPSTAATEREDLVEIFLTGICTAAQGCPGGVPALEADLNSQLINEDVDPATFQPSEMQRLNMAVPPSAEPSRLGVLGGDFAGFPNGRRLTDDVVDIELQVLEGALLDNPNDLGDAVDSNDVPFEASFPYVALPHDGAVNLSRFTGFERLAGADRFATAADIAIDTFGRSNTVLLASGLDRNLPDALAGNYLAGVEDAPILLTTPGTLPDVTRRALDALGATEVIILGGTAAVSAAQEDQLNNNRAVTRIGGRDRYETAARIATSRPNTVGQATAILARGDQLADALVAGPISFRQNFPVVLTRPTGGVDGFARAALDQLNIERVIVAGGPAAISDATVESAQDVGGNDAIAAFRVFGRNRQETSVAFADFATGELGFERLQVNLARGDNGADALAGGPHAGRESGVILLTVNNTVLGTVAQAYLADESITLEGGHVFGGPAAISAAMVAEATDAANSNDSVELARIQETPGN